MTRHVIIGSGVAGFMAAQTLRGLDPQAEITLVSDDPHGFYSRPGLAYLLSGEIPEKRLFIFSKKGRLTVDLQHIKAHVTRLDPRAHAIETTTAGKSAGRLGYDRLLIATGASAVPLGVPGAGLQGIVKLDDLQDTRQILALARRAKTAVVVGGGVVGIELVEGLAAHGIKVHYFLRGERYWPAVLSEDESKIVERHLLEDEVVIHPHTEVAEVLGRLGKVSGVRTSQGNVVACDLLAVGIGVRSNLGLAREAGLKTERGIQVNEYLQTSDPDIFAAGDVAQIYDPLSGRSSVDNLWYPARKQGHAAALNMAGQKQAYQRSAAVNVLRLAGVMTTIIGAIGGIPEEGQAYTTRGSSETWQPLPNTLPAESGTDVSHLRLVVGEQALLGALVMGSQKISRPLREMVNARVDISPIRAKLLQSGENLGQDILDFWIKTKGAG
jgi:NADPH-dependent 2,4-dienoyl-CoA reductase/sulfur reductase-like enzyme